MASPFGRRSRGRTPAARARLDGDDALRLVALRPVDRVELHLRSLRQRLEALADDRGMVDEHVLPAACRGDEPIPLRIVEPLHGSGCHTKHLLDHERTGRGSARRATGTRSAIAGTVAPIPSRAVWQ